MTPFQALKVAIAIPAALLVLWLLGSAGAAEASRLLREMAMGAPTILVSQWDLRGLGLVLLVVPLGGFAVLLIRSTRTCTPVPIALAFVVSLASVPLLSKLPAAAAGTRLAAAGYVRCVALDRIDRPGRNQRVFEGWAKPGGCPAG